MSTGPLEPTGIAPSFGLVTAVAGTSSAAEEPGAEIDADEVERSEASEGGLVGVPL